MTDRGSVLILDSRVSIMKESLSYVRGEFRPID